MSWVSNKKETSCYPSTLSRPQASALQTTVWFSLPAFHFSVCDCCSTNLEAAVLFLLVLRGQKKELVRMSWKNQASYE